LDRLELTTDGSRRRRTKRGRALRIAVALGLLAFSRDARALDPASALTDFRPRVWTSDHGLPQDSVYALCQTRDGYLWIGTGEGLARFDGRGFHVFSRSNTAALASNSIRALHEDADGALWIGTAGGGLTRLQGGVFTTLGPKDGIHGGSALAILEDRKKRLWVANWDGVLLRTAKGFHRYTFEDGLAHWNVHSIAEDADGRIWFGTGGGVSLWEENGRFRSYTTKHGLSHNVVRVVYVDRGKNLWVGTDAGLDRFDGTRFVHHGGRASVRALAADRDGNLWVGTSAGVTKAVPDGLSSALVRGLPGDAVTALYEDEEGTLWAGSQGSGLVQVTDVPFGSFERADGLPNDHVKSVHEGPDRSLWIATMGGGLARLKDGRFASHAAPASLASASVLSVWADRRGRVWIRAGGHVDVLENGRVRRAIAQFPETATSGAFYEERSGRMWVVGYGAIYREQEDELVRVPVPSPRDDALYLSVTQTRDGALWFGELRGLLRLQGSTFTTYTTANGLSHDYVTALYEDRAGTLWIGTGGGGLCRRAGEGFRCFSSRDGLPSDNVFAILEDDRQTLWMSSSRGIFRVRKDDLEAFEAGRHKRIATTLYGVADGLPSSMCEGESQPAAARTRDGKLWFPTTRGLAWVDPQRLDRLKIAQPPPAVVQRLVVDGQEVALSGPVRLPPGRRRLEMHFAGLSFIAPSLVRYRYKLDGFDRDWVEAGTQTAAHYTGLKPGRYTFRVSASNKDGVWSARDAVLPLELQPHFYERRGFGFVLVLALVSVAGVGHVLRMRLARRRFDAILSERLRLARELHDSLEQELAALGIQIVMLKDGLAETAAARGPIETMSGILARCAASVRAAVWDLRSGHDLAGALRAIAERLAAGRPIAVTVEVEGEPASLPEAVQRQLLRIGQEAVTNAVRHAEPRSIRIWLSAGPRAARLRVKDDGRGFDTAQRREGHFGLVGMGERVQEMKGQIQVASEPGAGTEVTVEVALE
jgi:ligand-binding sensor domain-containing protein/signal transduction histidine kinase